MAGVGEHGMGMGKGVGSQGPHPSPNEEWSLGDPDPQQKSTPELGWRCKAAQQHPGRKEVFQQSHWHGPGSDRRVSAQPHTMFEVSWFSTAFTASDTMLSHQDLSPVSTPALPVCLNLGAWRSPCLKLQDTSSATVEFPAPNSLWAASHQARQTTPSEGSDPTRQASATAFQQGESTEVTMSWLEGRKLSVPQ